jgi:hypothetical protein
VFRLHCLIVSLYDTTIKPGRRWGRR